MGDYAPNNGHTLRGQVGDLRPFIWIHNTPFAAAGRSGMKSAELVLDVFCNCKTRDTCGEGGF